jgi:hypothetical protein
LEKSGKVFRLVDTNGTVVAGSWDQPPDYYGLTLESPRLDRGGSR